MCSKELTIYFNLTLFLEGWFQSFFFFSIKFLVYFLYIDTTTTILTYIFFEPRKLG